MTIPYEEFKARLLADPEVKAEYDALAPEFEIAIELIQARMRAGLSQASRRSHVWRAARPSPARRLCCVLPKRQAPRFRFACLPHNDLGITRTLP
jgi:hypothetical protein